MKGAPEIDYQTSLKLFPRNHGCLSVPKINRKCYNEGPFQDEA